VRNVNRDSSDAARLTKCTADRPRRRPTQPGLTFVGAAAVRRLDNLLGTYT